MVKDGVVVSQNTNSNIYLNGNKRIEICGELNAKAHMGVTTEKDVFARGDGTNVVDAGAYADKFFHDGGKPVYVKGGELLIGFILEQEPVSSLELVKLCQEKLGWKRTTTYTVMKRLAERGVLKLENGIVTSMISRETMEKAEIETFVESRFGGSLPACVAAFTRHQRLSDRDLEEVQKMIDRIRQGGGQE